MYRDIPISYKLENGNTQYLKIELLEVNYKSPNSDTVYKEYSTSKDSNYVRIKIGDPNKLIQGTWVYTISYRVKYLIENYANLDKLYLNVLGDTWEDPILSVNATVTMPSKIKEIHCYTGPKGSTKSECSISYLGENKAQITSDKTFKKGEYLTITSTVDPGTIIKLDEEKSAYNKEFIQNNSQDSQADDMESLQAVIKWVISISSILFSLLIIITIIVIFKKQITSSKLYFDKYLPGTIPQYNIPTGWYILKAAVFLKNNIPSHAISAQIIQLCVYGYLRIRKNGETIFIEKTEKPTDTLADPLKDFYNGLMQGKQSVEVKKIDTSSLQDYLVGTYNEDYTYSSIFMNSVNIAKDKIFRELYDEGYFFQKEKEKNKTTTRKKHMSSLYSLY